MNHTLEWKRTLPALGLLAGLILLLFGLAVQPAAAATIVVNGNGDTTATDGICTLREAINNANSDTTGGDCAAGSGADTITFGADYTITLAGSQLPAVTSEMTITGNGAANTIIEAASTPNTAGHRVFQVASTGNLSLAGVTVRHGRCVGACVTTNGNQEGGGIFNDGGTLTVTDSTLSANSVRDYGAGISSQEGTVTVTNSTFSGNSADVWGGAIYIYDGSLSVTDSIIFDNSAPFGEAGGIYSDNSTTAVTNSTISGNMADVGDSGGIYNQRGTMTVTSSTISGNRSAFRGGGIFSNDTLTVINSTLSGNTSGEDGGGIFNEGTLTVTNSTLSGNTAGDGGGGIFSGVALTLTRSLVSGNSAVEDGDEIRSRSTITVDAFNVLGHAGQTNADAFSGFVPGASDFNATSDGGTPVALTDILDTTLADNGGPTETHALVAGSPAIDLGPTADCAAAPVNGVDQRGEPRSIDIPVTGDDGGGNLCDAGAFEVQLPSSRATFRVTKDFTDDNPTPVDVHLSCNTGLILDQSASVVDPDGADVGAEVLVGEGAAGVVVAQNRFTEIIFVVTHFDSGELNCELTETVPAGYDVSYFNGSVSNDISCNYENVASGSAFDCEITNTPAPVEVTITKDWIFEGISDGNGINLNYRLTLWCDAEIVGGYNPYDLSLDSAQGIGPGCGLIFLKQEGAQGYPIHDWCKAFWGEGPDVFDAEVIPEYPDSNCFVIETVYDSAVEIDNGCGSLTVGAGQGDSCTITNTVFFEGIPTLDRFGLAIMVLLTMGVGLIAFRRMV